jgi:hypothetical protein
VESGGGGAGSNTTFRPLPKAANKTSPRATKTNPMAAIVKGTRQRNTFMLD